MTRGVARHFRLAFRSHRAAPAVTLAAVLTLAVGIGATTAIFSVANGLILRPLPVKNPGRLVTVTSETALRYGFQAGAGWNFAMWDRFRQRADAFDGAFAWTLERLDLSSGGEMQPVNALFASGGFFSTLDTDALIGRTFSAADDVRGGGPDGGVVVISHDLWQRRFNGAAGVIGTRLSIEGTPLTIVGVAPAGFRGMDVGQPFDVALPFGADALVRGPRSLLDNQRALALTVMLRLKPGQTAAEATAAMRAVQPEILGRDAPKFLEEPFMLVSASTGISDRSRLRQQYGRPLVTLSIVAGLVLLIACVNVANLLLGRAAARRHELSVRLALGAPRWRLAGQLFVEGLALGVGGALAGTLFAAWAGRALVARLPASGRPVVLDLPLDWRVLAFTAGITLIAVLIFSAAPAFHAARVPPAQALQDEGRSGAAGRTRLLSSGLVVAQVALSIVLLAAAGLFVRTLDRLASTPLGFEPKALLVIVVERARALTDPAARMQAADRLRAAIAATPGVTHAAGSVWTPVGAGGGGLLTDARGRRADAAGSVAFNFVTPGWFATYGTAIKMGRDFDERDGATAPRVALVNETLRRTLLRDRAPIGEAIHAGPCGRVGCVVVGVVADAVYGQSLRDAPPPTMYVPLAQSAGLAPPNAPLRISVRAARNPADLAPALAAAMRAVDPGLAYSFRPLETDLDASVAQERVLATLAGFFGAVGLLLAAIGLYGITSYAVTRRRAEIGIRLVLGGQPSAVVRLVLTRIGLVVLAGVAAGLAAAVWLARFVSPLLHGLEPHDPLTLATSAVLLALVAGLAAWIPASRAARLDPAQVLREH